MRDPSVENPPAFPSGKIDAGSCWEDFPYLGLSLRDYFAGQAMLLLSPDTLSALHDEAQSLGMPVSAAMASFAYEMADAMLKERAK